MTTEEISKYKHDLTGGFKTISSIMNLIVQLDDVNKIKELAGRVNELCHERTKLSNEVFLKIKSHFN